MPRAKATSRMKSPTIVAQVDGKQYTAQVEPPTPNNELRLMKMAQADAGPAITVRTLRKGERR